MMHVDTALSGFTYRPNYVVSIVGKLGKKFDDAGDVFAGGAVVSAPTPKGFAVYLRARYCGQHMWNVREHCEYSADHVQMWNDN